MPRPLIYVETTVPSAYHYTEASPARLRMREITRRWWAAAQVEARLVTSPVTEGELRNGPPQHRAEWLDLLRRIESLPYDETIERIAETYLRHKLMPGPPSVDALHVALASYYNCDVLVTWDVRHIANPNKVRQLTRMNLALGLRTPRLATPEQLLAEG